MKTIYPEETLTALAEYDVLIQNIMENCQRLYPQDWQRYMHEDGTYQECIAAKSRIIGMSTCTYQFDVGEAAQWYKREQERGREIMELHTMGDLVASGESDLTALAATGNSVACEWLAKVQAEPIAVMKLFIFGEMKVALMHDETTEAQGVYRTLFPEE